MNVPSVFRNTVSQSDRRLLSVSCEPNENVQWDHAHKHWDMWVPWPIAHTSQSYPPTTDDGDIVSRGNSCLHTFHSDCLQCWMQKQPSCPCCRQNIMEEASYCGEEDSIIENETWARLLEYLKDSMSMLSISWRSQRRTRQLSGSSQMMMCFCPRSSQKIIHSALVNYSTLFLY